MQKPKDLHKVISGALFVLFFSIFWFLFWDEYIDFHEQKTEIENQNNITTDKFRDFSLDKIKDFWEIELFINPQKELLNKITESIDNSKQRVYLEVYIFTEKRIRKALIDAHKRWIDVKVLLEKNPYMAYNLNNKAYDELKKAWVDVKWSNSKNYSLNHSKFLIFDDKVVISTWNYSYSTFAYNRDFFLFIDDKSFLKDMENIFLNDFAWNKVSFYNHNLVLSPTYSRFKIENLINSSKENIKMYFPYIKDEKLEKLIIKKAKEGIKIDLIVSKSMLEDNKEKFEEIKKNWINIKSLKKPKLHSKSILVDSKYLYIWSINFSNYSIDKNREVWVILKDKIIIEKFINLFLEDIKR